MDFRARVLAELGIRISSTEPSDPQPSWRICVKGGGLSLGKLWCAACSPLATAIAWRTTATLFLELSLAVLKELTLRELIWWTALEDMVVDAS
jgi:hypothetical protein